VIGSEIVGLVPQAALDMCADFFLQVENFNRGQILENRLQAALATVDREARESAASRTVATGILGHDDWELS